jgi:hypothetical protein
MIQVKILNFSELTHNKKKQSFFAESIFLPSVYGPSFMDDRSGKVVIDLVPGKIKIIKSTEQITEMDIPAGIAYFGKNQTLHILLK